VSGTFNLPPATSFYQLFPRGGVARVLLVDGLGVVQADVALPSGIYSPATKRGWTQARNALTWTYRDRTGAAPGGIESLVVKSSRRTAGIPGAPARLKLTGRRGTYPFTDATTPANVVVTLGDQAAAASGRCAESGFSAATCSFNAGRNRLLCTR
jgi:hypothetical protein